MTDDLQYNPPSIDPAQRGSVFGTIQFIVDKMVMQEIDKLMPCKVIAVDRTTNRVRVEIQVNMVSTAGETTVRAQIASIPIYSPSAGGYVINFPVKADDLGWIKATDTDISLFLQNLKQSPPNTNLMHKFDSAVFYPDNMNKGVTINAEDADNLVIQKYDNTVRIALWPAKVKVTAPELLVDCPQVTVNSTDVTVNTATAEVVASGAVSVTSSSTVEVAASTSITLDAPITYITGALAAGSGTGDGAVFSGPISTTQTVTGGTDVIGGGKSLNSHVHSGVQPGGGDTGPPV